MKLAELRMRVNTQLSRPRSFSNHKDIDAAMLMKHILDVYDAAGRFVLDHNVVFQVRSGPTGEETKALVEGDLLKPMKDAIMAVEAME
jgi:hypothetical protein